MKALFLLSVALCGGLALHAQVTYVNASAGGANDGSSWANAYTTLQAALDNPSANEIWVAAGVYRPGDAAADSLARFALSRTLALYGGFAGNETSLDQRNPATNLTLLSGDLLGNDTDDNFTLNKTDNVLHVVYVDSLLTGGVVIDGFTIGYGQGRPAAAGIPPYFYNGAGIYALSPMTLRNCTFLQNQAAGGAACFGVSVAVAGTLVEGCTFRQNRATNQGVCFFTNTSNITVRDNRFEANLTTRGALYLAASVNVLVEDCEFVSNVNPFPSPNQFGAGAFFWQNRNVTVRGCSFNGNRAENAAAMYVDARSVSGVNPANFVLDNCTFASNTATGYGGGGIYFFQAAYTLRNSIFEGNSAGSSGGALVNLGDNRVYRIEDCTFNDNIANFGGAMNNYNLGTALIRGCSFANNQAATSGGAVINGFKIHVTFEDCVFENNEARWGGAMYVQNDTTATTLRRCDFVSNTAENFGGGVNVAGGVAVSVDSCYFEFNQANFGGGLSVSDGANNQASLLLTRSTFNTNVAGNQGGGLNLSNTDAEVVNCLFNGNIADGIGEGGAISTNSAEAGGASLVVLNCTLADNVGLLAAGLASWTTDTTTAQVRIQNTALANLGLNYAVTGGAPTLVSGGGNFVNDLSAPDLNLLTDLVGLGLDPQFVDPNDFDYRPADGSPLIDAGVTDGAPATDLTGMARDNSPDIGAYEALVVATQMPSAAAALSLWPNPASTSIWLGLPAAWEGKPVTLRWIDQTGRILWHNPTRVAGPRHEVAIPPTLAAGVYTLSVQQGRQLLLGQVVVVAAQ